MDKCGTHHTRTQKRKERKTDLRLWKNVSAEIDITKKYLTVYAAVYGTAQKIIELITCGYSLLIQFFLNVFFTLCKSRQEKSVEFRNVVNLLSKQKRPTYQKKSVKFLKQVPSATLIHGTLVVAQQAKVNLVGAGKTQ